MTKLHRRAAGAFIALALAAASVVFAQSAQAYGGSAATLSLSSNTVQQGGTVTATGAHLHPNSAVTLALHSARADVGTATTDGNGTFSAAITVPANFPAGAHTVTATDAAGESASADLTVTASGAGSVTVSDSTPTAGASITVSGTSCNPNAAVTVSLDNGKYPLGSTTADGSGAYSLKVKLPGGVTGDHTITVAGAGCSGVEAITIASSSGGLAGTGVAVVSLGGVGLLLLVAGGLTLLAGRRRATTTA